MKTRLQTLFVALMMCYWAFAQSVQYGYTEEYNGAKDKTPLADVNINAGGATAKSERSGKFKLEFKNLNVGDRVAVDVNNVAMLKNYVLFNKEAVEQWTVSGKSVYFRIVLCKKKTFDDLVMTYYNVSDKSYKEQLRKERDNAKKLEEQGEIQQKEYERLLKEADDRYQNAVKHIRENAELVARIDESELEGNQAEILRLAKEGRLDEAVELIKKSNTVELLVKTLTKNEYVAERKKYFEHKEAESRDEMKRLAKILKNDIKILQLAGGKENLDLCGEYWERVIAADSTDLMNIKEGAYFFQLQNKFDRAEKYYVKALTWYEIDKTNQITFASDYTYVLNNLGVLYRCSNKHELAEELYLKALAIRKTLVEREPDIYNCDYAISMNNLGVLYKELNQNDLAEKFYLQTFEIYKSLAEQYPEIFNPELAKILNNLGNLYVDLNDFSNAENYFLQALKIYELLVVQDSNVHNPIYALILNNIGNMYNDIGQYEKGEVFLLQALELRKSLAERNPDAYNNNYVQSLNNLGLKYYSIQQYDKGETYLLQALELCTLLVEQNPNAYTNLYMILLENLGGLYSNLEQNAKSEEYYLQALEISKSLADKNPKTYIFYYSRSLYNLGNQYLFTRQFSKSEEYHKQALMIRKSLAEQNPQTFKRYYVSSLNNVSFVALYNKKFDDAEKYAREALAVDSSKKPAKINLIASILFQGRYAEAEKIAIEIKDEEWNGKLLKVAILEDLKSFEDDAIIPEERMADVERLRKVLK